MEIFDVSRNPNWKRLKLETPSSWKLKMAITNYDSPNIGFIRGLKFDDRMRANEANLIENHSKLKGLPGLPVCLGCLTGAGQAK
jgi:hypothetical protein